MMNWKCEALALLGHDGENFFGLLVPRVWLGVPRVLGDAYRQSHHVINSCTDECFRRNPAPSGSILHFQT